MIACEDSNKETRAARCGDVCRVPGILRLAGVMERTVGPPDGPRLNHG